jgi:hypothetical protein
MHVQIPTIDSELRINVFWVITPCSLLKVDGRFGGILPPISGQKKRQRM